MGRENEPLEFPLLRLRNQEEIREWPGDAFHGSSLLRGRIRMAMHWMLVWQYPRMEFRGG